MGAPKDIIQYITFASLGNTADFGDLSDVRYQCSCTASNGTIGIVAGGRPTGGAIDVIEYITFATPGNAVDFGDLTAATTNSAGATNGVRMLIAGGIRS